ncbi:MAG: YmfQ family protein, partial [Oscillospiraceae bacterium]|nr:YmfQ family protein [Oscillospiraceae bacterium]
MTIDNEQLTIVSSASARRMLWMVTRGFYDRSRLGLWMFEAMGREYDEMAEWTQNLALEFFPQTCTWSIGFWEQLYGIESDVSLPLDFRRGRIRAKKLQKPPLNPARIEAAIFALTGVPIALVESDEPYTFEVVLKPTDDEPNHSLMFRTIRAIKPSHLSFTTILPLNSETKLTTTAAFLQSTTHTLNTAVNLNLNVNLNAEKS